MTILLSLATEAQARHGVRNDESAPTGSARMSIRARSTRKSHGRRVLIRQRPPGTVKRPSRRRQRRWWTQQDPGIPARTRRYAPAQNETLRNLETKARNLEM
jgi:hypothetical protein